MAAVMTVTVTGGPTIAIRSPYDPDFVRGAHKIGGNYRGNIWEFDPRSEELARELCRTVYGTDGSDAGEPTLTVRIPLDGVTGQEFRPAGDALVARHSRDEPVRLASYVVVVAGGFAARGGSVKNPRIDADPGTIIEVRDLPAGAARKILADDATAELVDTASAGPQTQRAQLAAERARLTARIAEIDQALTALDQVTA